MSNSTLVKLKLAGAELYLRTISRERKSPQNIMITTYSINSLCEPSQTARIERHEDSFVEMWKDSAYEMVHFRISWLNRDGSWITGWEQEINLPFSDLMQFIHGKMGREWTVLSLKRPEYPKLVFCETDNLREAVNNLAVRRKLVRVLRDGFDFIRADKIMFYNEKAPYSFLFYLMNHEKDIGAATLTLEGQENMRRAQYTIRH